jgi:peptidoglycan lytic transglycosylase
LRNRKRKNKRFTKFLLLLLAAGSCWGLYLWRNSLRDMLTMGSENAFDQYIYEAAEKHNVDPMLIKAVINQETRFNPDARGGAGEVGLMQIIRNKSVADWAVAHKVKAPQNGDLFRPQINIDIGTWYLKQALERWRKYKYYRELALCQYNAGGSWAVKWAPKKIDEPFMDKISIGSTKEYVRRVIEKYHNYTARNKKQKK